MDVTAHLLYFVYNWFTVKLYCCYRWVFYIIIHYMVIISLHIDMLCIIVSSQTNYTVVIDTFLYHSPLHCYHIVMFTVFCITLFTIQYISFMNQY